MSLDPNPFADTTVSRLKYLVPPQNSDKKSPANLLFFYNLHTPYNTNTVRIILKQNRIRYISPSGQVQSLSVQKRNILTYLSQISSDFLLCFKFHSLFGNFYRLFPRVVYYALPKLQYGRSAHGKFI